MIPTFHLMGFAYLKLIEWRCSPGFALRTVQEGGAYHWWWWWRLGNVLVVLVAVLVVAWWSPGCGVLRRPPGVLVINVAAAAPRCPPVAAMTVLPAALPRWASAVASKKPPPGPRQGTKDL